MSKPAVTLKSTVQPQALTYQQLDDNFTNLRDATISVTAGTAGTEVVSDLNGNITLVAGSGIGIVGDNTAKTVTIEITSQGSEASGIVNAGLAGRIAFYPSDGTTVDDSNILTLDPSINSATLNGALKVNGILQAPGDTGLISVGTTANGITGFMNSNQQAAVIMNRSAKSGVTAGISTLRLKGMGPSLTNSAPFIEEAEILIGPNKSGFDSGGSGISVAARSVFIESEKLQLGSTFFDADGLITTGGTKNLTFNTNNGTNSGNINIENGTGGNISIVPNGIGKTVIKNIVVNEFIHNLETASGTITPNAANGNVQLISLTGNLTINEFNTPVAGQSITLIINTNGTNRTLTSTMKFAGGVNTLSTTNTTDILHMFFDGVNYFARLENNFV